LSFSDLISVYPESACNSKSILSPKRLMTEPEWGFAFVLETKVRKFVLAAKTKKDRNVWIRELSRAIDIYSSTISPAKA